ncbi:hypothetical protein OIE69_05190 [Actinacidiphila glaucinigra]|nr:hypothetical protein [Actinacidiphila glaucinigra]WSD58336.1 hypothetical protein OIE69_05190 [Actinacidiphila glaucinigra]
MIAALMLGLPVFLLGLMLVLSAVEDRIVSPPPTPQPSASPNAPGTHTP